MNNILILIASLCLLVLVAAGNIYLNDWQYKRCTEAGGTFLRSINSERSLCEMPK